MFYWHNLHLFNFFLQMPSSAICERRHNGVILNHKNDINCVGVNNTHLDIVKQDCDDRSFCEVIKPSLFVSITRSRNQGNYVNKSASFIKVPT